MREGCATWVVGVKRKDQVIVCGLNTKSRIDDKHHHHHRFILPKNKNIIINNTIEIQLMGRQTKNIKFMKLAPMLYTVLIR